MSRMQNAQKVMITGLVLLCFGMAATLLGAIARSVAAMVPGWCLMGLAVGFIALAQYENRCPHCERVLPIRFRWRGRFCAHCGQKIEW